MPATGAPSAFASARRPRGRRRSRASRRPACGSTAAGAWRVSRRGDDAAVALADGDEAVALGRRLDHVHALARGAGRPTAWIFTSYWSDQKYGTAVYGRALGRRATALRPASVPCSAALVQCSTRIGSPSASGCGHEAMSPAAKTSSAPRPVSVASHTTPRLERRGPSPRATRCSGSRRARRRRRRRRRACRRRADRRERAPSPTQRVDAGRRAAGRRRARGAGRRSARRARAERRHRLRRDVDQRHVEAELARRRRDLAADEAGADDRQPRPASSAALQRERVVEVAQRVQAVRARRPARPRCARGSRWRRSARSYATGSSPSSTVRCAVDVERRSPARRGATRRRARRTGSAPASASSRAGEQLLGQRRARVGHVLLLADDDQLALVARRRARPARRAGPRATRRR